MYNRPKAIITFETQIQSQRKRAIFKERQERSQTDLRRLFH